LAAKVAFAKLYDRKTPITAAEIHNDRVVPFLWRARHLPIARADRSRYRVLQHPGPRIQTLSGRRGHRSQPNQDQDPANQWHRIAFRKKIYQAIDELQSDLDTGLVDYNQQRPHQGRWCFGTTPMQTFLDAIRLAKEKSWRRDDRRQLQRLNQQQRLSGQVSTNTREDQQLRRERSKAGAWKSI
jgi:hypothetical protein